MILPLRKLPLWLFAFVLGLLTLLGVVSPGAEAAGPPVQALLTASPLEVGKPGALTVELRVPSGVVVYSAETSLTPLSKGTLTLRPTEYPPGEMKPDPVTGEPIEVWSNDVALRVPVDAPQAAGRHDVALELRVVGCKGNICFLPHTETLRASVEVKPKAVGWLDTLLPSAYAGKLSDENPVNVTVKVKGEALAVSFEQAPGWHLTQSFTFVELAEGQDVSLGKVGWPKAHQRPDPAIPGATRGEYDGNFTVLAALKSAPGGRVVKGTVGYQACKAELCLMPQYLDFSETVTFAAPAPAAPANPADPATPAVDPVVEPVAEPVAEPVVEAPPVEPVVEAPAATPALADNSNAAATADDFESELPVDGFAAAREKGLVWLFLFVFGAGFLVSLTPCVLPMVPITIGIIGARSTGSRVQAFSLALAYVAGLAAVYTVLGVGAAMTGSIFGAWMQSPWVVGAVALFFFAMGAAMFGAFEVAVPGAVAERLNNVGGAGYTGAFLIGAVGAIVAGPCSGPVIASLMVVIGQQGELALGAGLMLAFSLGMGMIFLVAGTFSNQVLRPGAWMETVKHSFGVLMWLGAVYFVAPHLSDTMTALLTAFTLLSTAVFAWPSNDDDGPAIARAHRLYAVVGGLVGAYLLVGTLVTQGFILPPLQLSAAGAATGAAQGSIPWINDDETSALARAKAENKPLIIDFTAEWCAACKELEHFTYTDAEVITRSADFVPLMIDATSDKDPKVQALLKKYDVKGLPTVLFLKPDGAVISKLTLTGFEPADKFLPRMSAAKRMAQ
ncbi:thioredoxin family protein [Myxococcota bacterium]|nr:thioredoxin family protein [Myxococcota bacterium]